MPTYEYRCKGCGRHLEVVQAFTDAALTECEACGGELRKVFGNVGISFKGSGFYKNDSRSSTKTGSAAKSGSEKSSEPASSSSDAGSSTNGSSAKGNGSTDKAKGTSDTGSSSSKSSTSGSKS